MPTLPTKARLYPQRRVDPSSAGSRRSFGRRMRTVFVLYLVLIACGLTTFIVIGLAHY
jgi:hypothetical protein